MPKLNSIADSDATALIDFLPSSNSADYERDCAHGRAIARHVSRQIREGGNPCLLGPLIKTMVARGHFGGVVVGFAHEIAEALLV